MKRVVHVFTVSQVFTCLTCPYEFAHVSHVSLTFLVYRVVHVFTVFSCCTCFKCFISCTSCTRLTCLARWMCFTCCKVFTCLHVSCIFSFFLQLLHVFTCFYMFSSFHMFLHVLHVLMRFICFTRFTQNVLNMFYSFHMLPPETENCTIFLVINYRIALHFLVSTKIINFYITRFGLCIYFTLHDSASFVQIRALDTRESCSERILCVAQQFILKKAQTGHILSFFFVV